MAITHQKCVGTGYFDRAIQWVKFTPNGGAVKVSARKVTCKLRSGLRQDDPANRVVIEELVNAEDSARENTTSGIEVCVTDSGIDIKPEDLKRIFNRFEQIKPSGYALKP
jgi:signal transduction histidine kinase